MSPCLAVFLVYDSALVDFVAVHNLPSCDWGCECAYIVAPFLARALRTNQPHRFRGPESDDFALLF